MILWPAETYDCDMGCRRAMTLVGTGNYFACDLFSPVIIFGAKQDVKESIAWLYGLGFSVLDSEILGLLSGSGPCLHHHALPEL